MFHSNYCMLHWQQVRIDKGGQVLTIRARILSVLVEYFSKHYMKGYQLTLKSLGFKNAEERLILINRLLL